VDWYPTLLKLCGAQAQQGQLAVDGHDIWPTLTDGQPSPHDAILINSAPNTGAVRMGEWKLVVRSGEDDSDGGPARRFPTESVELFHLAVDPYETTNLAEKYPAKVTELKARLNEFAKEAVPPKARPKAPDFQSPSVWGEAEKPST
jgi:arylsulfatase A-like enzyme